MDWKVVWKEAVNPHILPSPGALSYKRGLPRNSCLLIVNAWLNLGSKEENKKYPDDPRFLEKLLIINRK